MSTTNRLSNIPVSRNLHPAVYGLLAGSVLWITLAIWIFFARNVYIGLQLAVVTVFAIAFVATPLVLWRLSARVPAEHTALTDWLGRELDTYTGRIHGSHAAVMVLLAPLACAMGITSVALIARLAAAGAL